MENEAIIHKYNYKNFSLGLKAENLFFLTEQGFPVPEFICIQKTTGREETERYLREHFPSGICFAVRSAAKVEDGGTYSFAGQFSTYLSVPLSECWERAQQIFSETARADIYAEYTGQGWQDFAVDVMIQQMIDAETSGVLFTANPQGLLNEMVIAAAAGAGNGVVEDRLPSAVCYFNRTDKLFYCEGRSNAPLLDDEALAELTEYGERIEALFGTYQDIEFAIKEGRIFILQARPVTSIGANGKTIQMGGSPIVLDNSNIVESYPGISLPATQSFARRVYYQVFKSCLFRLCRDRKAVRERDTMLQNMVSSCSGRIYYQISSWYEILLLLPFSSKIIPIWQEMLGVREKKVGEGPPRKPGLCLKGSVTVSFFHLLFTCPKQMEELNRYFNSLIQTTDLGQCRDGGELLDYYHYLENLLSSRWDITLVNDMYTFLYTALLKRAAGEAGANEILSEVTGLESMKPLKELLGIAAWVRKNGGEPMVRELCGLKDNGEADAFFGKYPDLAGRVAEYIDSYGDRYMEELKLESNTYRTDPVLLLRQIGEYASREQGAEAESAGKESVRTGISETKDAGIGGRGTGCAGVEGTDSENVEAEGTGEEGGERVREKKFSGLLVRMAARRAASGIRNRELSRMNRSRIFGLVREIFLRIGAKLSEKGRLEEARDVFYLFFEEIEEAVRKETDCRETVRLRKAEYAGYEKLPAYSRLVFCNEIFDRKAAPDPVSFRAGAVPSVLHGTPSCAGIVEGEVLVVRNPSEAGNSAGKILVAPMTDPGWVFLIAQAKALVAEKGSLLSHTAIVTREMKKPSVVGVPRASEQLKNGDWVRVNGTSGEITILRRNGGEEHHEEH